MIMISTLNTYSVARMEAKKKDSKTEKKSTRPNWKTSSKTKIEMDFHSDARVTEVKCKLTQKW